MRMEAEVFKDIDGKLLEIKLGRVQFQKGLVSVSLQLSLFLTQSHTCLGGWVLVMMVLLFIYADEGNINNVLFRDVLSDNSLQSLYLCCIEMIMLS